MTALRVQQDTLALDFKKVISAETPGLKSENARILLQLILVYHKGKKVGADLVEFAKAQKVNIYWKLSLQIEKKKNGTVPRLRFKRQENYTNSAILENVKSQMVWLVAP